MKVLECIKTRLVIWFGVPHLILFLCLISSCTTSQLSAGLKTADSLIHVIQTVLGPTIEATRAACEEKERELKAHGEREIEVAAAIGRLRADCAGLNDALLAVDEARIEALAAVESGKPEQVDAAIEKLRLASKELDEVVATTWMAARTPVPPTRR